MRKSVSQVRDDFDHIARIAERVQASEDGPPEPHERYLLHHLPRPCDAVLELGCGTGELSRRLASLARTIVALDVSTEMIRVARSRSAKRPNIEHVVGDMTRLPLRRAAFDCVVSLNTLHHVDTVHALRAMREALRPGGTLLIADVLDRSGARNLPINLVAWIARLVRRTTVDRKTQRLALRRAYVAHGCGETHPTLDQVRATVAAELPGAVVRGHLLWRYTIVWHALDAP
jgi:ubiquinone/menaquinone biosynthesis C-methylase UbiE